MKLREWIFIAASLGIILAIPNGYADATIIILRHAEKPSAGLGQLNCQGLNRALALAPVLLSRYGKPDAIYVPNPAILKNDQGIPYAYVRPLATAEPLAIRASLPITLVGEMSDTQSLVTMVNTRRTGTHVVVWEHHWAESVARQFLTSLGGNPADVPKWNDDDFDSIYVIRIKQHDDGTRQASFSHEQEGLNDMPTECAESSLDSVGR
jgi:hypothetical protein